jgi:hypothetical protein
MELPRNDGSKLIQGEPNYDDKILLEDWISWFNWKKKALLGLLTWTSLNVDFPAWRAKLIPKKASNLNTAGVTSQKA